MQHLRFLRNLHAKPWFRMRCVAKCEFCNAPMITVSAPYRFARRAILAFSTSRLRTSMR